MPTATRKPNNKCGRATDRARCEDMGCSFLVTDDPSDCEMTTTDTPTTTAMPGCCKGDSFASNSKCNTIDAKDKCNARSSCHFVEFGTLEIDCTFYSIPEARSRGILSEDTDAMANVMKVDKAPLKSYADMGGWR